MEWNVEWNGTWNGTGLHNSPRGLSGHYFGVVQNMDSGLWTGLWTEIWTGFWTDTQFNDDHFQHSVALNGLGYALATAYPVC